MIDAIVGNRSAGLTVVADHVTDPPLTNLLSVGMVPPLRDSCPKPSRTKRITCSVRGLVGAFCSSNEVEGCIVAAGDPTTDAIYRPMTSTHICQKIVVIKMRLHTLNLKGNGYISTRIFGKASRARCAAGRWRKGFPGGMLNARQGDNGCCVSLA